MTKTHSIRSAILSVIVNALFIWLIAQQFGWRL